MDDNIQISDDCILASFFAKVLGDPVRSVYDILKVKDHPIKVKNDISVEEFEKCCIKYQEQRKESFFEILKLCIFEQQVFLTKGYIDRSFRKRFKGVELADTPTVKAIVEKARYQYSRVDIGEYDDRIVHDYLWTISVTRRKATCVIGSAEDVMNYTMHCADVDAHPRIFLARDFWKDFNWLVNPGEIVAFI